MLRTIKQKLNLPTFILLALGLVASVAFWGSLSNLNAKKEALLALAQYQSKSEPLRTSINHFVEGELDKNSLLKEVRNIRDAPDIEIILFDDTLLESIEHKVEVLDTLLLENRDILVNVHDLTQQSIALSNGFLLFIRDKLLEQRDEVTPLEIMTIVGANTNTDMNYQIYTLFLQSILDTDTNAKALTRFITNSLANIEKDIAALAGTKMANAPVESLAKVKEIQSLSLKFLNNYRKIREIDASLLTDINQLIKQIRQASMEVTKQSLNTFSTLFACLMIGLAATIIAVAFVNYKIGCTILRPLNKLGYMASSLAENGGDLTRRLNISNDDEIGQVSRHFNSFLDVIHNIMSQTKAVSAGILAGTSRIDEMAQEINQEVSSQEVNIEATKAAVTQMSSAVNDVSNSASDNAESAIKTSQQSDDGVSRLQETLTHIQQMAAQMDASNQSMQQLDSFVDQIGVILESISSIADQTNLLALNAAIEAARAGEQGRGFSVVADEVRTLASRTQDSLAQTKAMIDRLQTESRNSVALIKQTKESGVLVSERAQQTSDSLQTINQMVEHISAGNHQIATAVEEQGNVTMEIDRSMGEIQETLIQTLSKTSRVTSETNGLYEECVRLEKMLGMFKTEAKIGTEK